MMRRATLAAILMLVGACVPPTVPPRLTNTPGPAVIITDERVTAGGLRMDIPAGWRVITSAADAPFTLFLAAPDACGIIALARRPVELPPTDCPDTAWTDAVELRIPTGFAYAAVRLPSTQSTDLWTNFVASIVEVDPDYRDPGISASRRR